MEMKIEAEAVPFWDRLSDEEKDLCRSSAVISRFPAGAYLLGQCKEEGCLGMLHILSGEVRAFILSEEGREITLFRLGKGENCVLSASCVLSQITFETHLCVTKEAEILMIPSSVFGSLTESNIYVRCFAYELATKRFSAVMWVMEQILFHGFDKRLAEFLLAEYRRTGSPEIPMTQEEIAVATNSVREVVARMEKQFAEDGLIESRRGVISLKNIEGLKAIR